MKLRWKIWAFAAIFFAASCHQNKTTNSPSISTTDLVARIPLKGVDVPFTEYSVAAETGDTIAYPTGTILLFPPDAFVDSQKRVIRGKVTVKYREFQRPIDYYLSGIPMSFDSAGIKYEFLSSGMCEVLAYKDGIPVFVNPKSKPEIDMLSFDKVLNSNLYFLDTLRGRWTQRGVVELIDLKSNPKAKKDKRQLNTSTWPSLAPPVMPKIADANHPVIQLIIDSQFKELSQYNNLKFELENGGKGFNPKDTAEIWNNVRLERGADPGSYIAFFSNPRREVSYPVRPVVDKKDYEEAMKVFDAHSNDYRATLKRRSAAIEEDSSMDSLANEFLLKEGKELDRLRSLFGAKDQKVKAMQMKLNRQGDSARSMSLVRSFQIDGFGFWNCDIFDRVKFRPFQAFFKDSTGSPIMLTNIATAYKNLKTISRFSGNQLSIAPNAEYMIFATFRGKFAFVPYDECRKIKIDSTTSAVTYKATIVPQSDFEQIKKVAEKW